MNPLSPFVTPEASLSGERAREGAPRRRHRLLRGLGRRSGGVLGALALVALATGLELRGLAVGRTGFASGWALLGLTLALAALGLRKRLVLLPLGSVARWSAWHAGLGLGAMLLFAQHLHWELPTGRFETILAGVYLVTVLSGVAGWALAWVLPRRLTTRGGTAIAERIPGYRHRLWEQAESLVAQGSRSPSAVALLELHRDRLLWFFAEPRHRFAHLLGSTRHRRRLLEALDGIRRYATPEERPSMDALGELIRAKDDLDCQWALQGLLRAWLWVHVPFATGTLLLVPLHGVLAYAVAAEAGA